MLKQWWEVIFFVSCIVLKLKTKFLKTKKHLFLGENEVLVRPCFTLLKDINDPNAFLPFFNLEKSESRHKQMTCLDLPESEVTVRKCDAMQKFFLSQYRRESYDAALLLKLTETFIKLEFDFYVIVCESFRDGLLPASCQSAVSSLLPEKKRPSAIKEVETSISVYHPREGLK